jgi:diguanylate cyclase (GGDEF)-like protein
LKELSIVIIGEKTAGLDRIAKICRALDFNVTLYSSETAVLSAISGEEYGFYLLQSPLPFPGEQHIRECIGSRCSGKPFQLIVLASFISGTPSAELFGVADDFINIAADDAEIHVRITCARMRLQRQIEIYNEKEFFRSAAKWEEELSSKALDQNLKLKKAYQEIDYLNKKLEKANRELETFARLDILSGLMNRASLHTVLDEEIERSLRSGISLSGIMLDIDFFKQINDRYGHQCGDSVIRAIGSFLAKGLRRYDHAGRYGGEEFFIVLPHTSLEEAAGIAERFRASIEELNIRYEEEVIYVRASLGVARYHGGESRESWIDRADKAMYRAKQNGRNRVETA